MKGIFERLFSPEETPEAKEARAAIALLGRIHNFARAESIDPDARLRIIADGCKTQLASLGYAPVTEVTSHAEVAA